MLPNLAYAHLVRILLHCTSRIVKTISSTGHMKVAGDNHAMMGCFPCGINPLGFQFLVPSFILLCNLKGKMNTKFLNTSKGITVK